MLSPSTFTLLLLWCFGIRFCVIFQRKCRHSKCHFQRYSAAVRAVECYTYYTAQSKHVWCVCSIQTVCPPLPPSVLWMSPRRASTTWISSVSPVHWARHSIGSHSRDFSVIHASRPVQTLHRPSTFHGGYSLQKSFFTASYCFGFCFSTYPTWQSVLNTGFNGGCQEADEKLAGVFFGVSILFVSLTFTIQLSTCFNTSQTHRKCQHVITINSIWVAEHSKEVWDYSRLQIGSSSYMHSISLPRWSLHHEKCFPYNAT